MSVESFEVAAMRVAADALRDRVILVVGAHGALGNEVVRAAAAAGATVVLLGRRVPKLNRLYDALRSSGAPEPAIYPLDLEGAGPADYEQLAEAIQRECGRLDGIVHAAAEFKGLSPFVSLAPEDLVRTAHVNATAPALLTQACLPLLSEREDAAIVVALDDPVRVERAYWGAYGMANAARAAWVRILADELENSPIRVHGLCPGPMRTTLRGKAYFSEDPGQWPDAAAYVPGFLAALVGSAALGRGGISRLRAAP